LKVECVEEGSCQRHLDIELPAEAVNKAFGQSIQQFSKRLKLPGFRKGKIPKDLIKTRFRSDILNQVVQDLVPGALEKAVTDKGLAPIDEPRISQVDVEEGKPLKFRASFEIMPAIEAKDFKGLEAVESKTEVSDEEIEKRLEAVRERAARFDPLEGRGVQDGDFVVGSIEEIPDGKGKPNRQEGALIEVGSSSYHPTLHEKLQGAKPGDIVSFRATFPPDHPDKQKAGRIFDIRVEVNEVKEKVLPELDDELAKDLGEFETLDELRTHIREQVENEAREADEQHLRNQLLDKLIEANPFDPPQSLVESELDRRVEELARSFVERGLDPQGSGIDWQAVREKQRESALQGIKATLLMDQITEQENLQETEEEVAGEIERIATQVNKKVEVVRAQLMKEGGMERLRRRLRREKAFDLLRQSARIQGS
jgi:trigger factor